MNSDSASGSNDQGGMPSAAENQFAQAIAAMGDSLPPPNDSSNSVSAQEAPVPMAPAVPVQIPANPEAPQARHTPSRKRKQPEPRNIQARKTERKLQDYFKVDRTKTASTPSSSNAPNSDSNSNDPYPNVAMTPPRTSAQKRSPSQQASDAKDPDCKVESTTEGPFDNQAKLKRMNEEVSTLNNDLQRERSRISTYKEVIRELLLERSKACRKAAREKNLADQLRIGQFKPTRVGEHFKDQWQDGYAMEEITAKLERVKQEREEIQNATINLKKKKAARGADAKRIADAPQVSSTNDVSKSASNSEDGFLKPELPKEMSVQEIYEQEEILKLRKEHLRKEEADLLVEKDRLERERNLHIREMKRIQCEEQSRFKGHVMLHHRYFLMSLLGKGGFSEVWRAYDLDENRYVACKIHHVNKEWKEDKKANYVKHAMREKDIHKSLNHPRIVRLFDLFTIDNDSFCTVLEYCDGNDLDFYLKQHKQIPEKEARSIIMQVVSALKYLNERKNPVIHYDLKPANILLQSGNAGGEIKITDFGLSKTIESSDDGESIELTSQGAGTYWYLPPETFQSYGHGITPKISSKVDVWSVGVIFYQCLYGRRPFGHERTQQQILQEKTILNASEVTFLQNPKISPLAQDFIRCCLQYNKDERADVRELAKHEYLKSPSKSGRVVSAT